jgi:hypothetical protein
MSGSRAQVRCSTHLTAAIVAVAGVAVAVAAVEVVAPAVPAMLT